MDFLFGAWFGSAWAHFVWVDWQWVKQGRFGPTSGGPCLPTQQNCGAAMESREESLRPEGLSAESARGRASRNRRRGEGRAGIQGPGSLFEASRFSSFLIQRTRKTSSRLCGHGAVWSGTKQEPCAACHGSALRSKKSKIDQSFNNLSAILPAVDSAGARRPRCIRGNNLPNSRNCVGRSRCPVESHAPLVVSF